MNIKKTNNISFGTTVTKQAKKELKQDFSRLKANQIIEQLENDGFDDFTMVNKGLVRVHHPTRKKIEVDIPKSIYKNPTSQEISQAITNTVIEFYLHKTGEYPIQNN